MEGILTSFETRSGSLGASINSRIKQVGSKTAKTVHSKVKMTGVLEIDRYNLNPPRSTYAIISSMRSWTGIRRTHAQIDIGGIGESAALRSSQQNTLGIQRGHKKKKKREESKKGNTAFKECQELEAGDEGTVNHMSMDPWINRHTASAAIKTHGYGRLPFNHWAGEGKKKGKEFENRKDRKQRGSYRWREPKRVISNWRRLDKMQANLLDKKGGIESLAQGLFTARASAKTKEEQDYSFIKVEENKWNTQRNKEGTLMQLATAYLKILSSLSSHQWEAQNCTGAHSIKIQAFLHIDYNQSTIISRHME
ncbi:hypothetical protein PPACK8108_LOCUS20472 [Phakopsora pachyrhizi]|uniref:Uncharacterized protein n=1 Tax=Phakopsora pachyrhizi TaxID=170000 RepID=A0AAV0BF37_PHAPC|nr:hypothetical protein PPACK8108_LOCUS20472 [Phakopsora pachyrhizi]